MAVSTVTCSTYLRTPKALHAGANIVFFNVDLGTSITVASIIKLAKLPDRAVLVDAGLFHAAASSDITLRLYSEASTSAKVSILSGTASGVTSQRMNLDYCGYQISISDNQLVKSWTLEGYAESATVSGTVKGYIMYTMEEA